MHNNLKIKFEQPIVCKIKKSINFFFTFSVQGLGAMRGKVNLDFEISPAPYFRHRALYLYHPTTDMTGDYMCKISTLQNEVSDTKKMVVYGKV